MLLAQQKLILVLALLAAILAFRKLKAGALAYRPRAVLLMGMGAGLLLFGALVGLFGSIGVLGIGYQKSWLIFLLESVVGYLGGGAALIWGMALWLPYVFSISIRLDKKAKSLKLHEFISKASVHGDASPATFGRIITEVIDLLGFQAASLHMMNTANKIELYSSVGLAEKTRKALAYAESGMIATVFKKGEIFQLDREGGLDDGIVYETTAGPVVEIISLPIDFGTRRIGVLTFFTNHPRVFSQEEIRTIEVVAANLGITFYRDGLMRSMVSLTSLRDFMAVILKSSRADDNFNTQAIRLARLLKSFVRFETLSIFLEGNGPIQQLDFNLQSGGRLIIEKGYFEADRYLPVRWVMAARRSLMLPRDAELLRSTSKDIPRGSSYYAPITISGETLGAVAISLKGEHTFGINDSLAIEAVVAVLSGIILKEKLNTLSAETFDKIGAVKYSLETIAKGKSDLNPLKELARIIAEKTPATFARIMMLDKAHDRLVTAALYQRRHLEWDEKSIAALPLSGLEAHDRVMKSGRPLLVSDWDKSMKISAVEKRLLLPSGINQCLILPLTVDDRVIGVITIGENRKAARDSLGQQELVYASLLTTAISLYLWKLESAGREKARMAAPESVPTLNRLGDSGGNVLEAWREFPSRINGALAGIMASCEYIRNREKIEKEELDRFLDMIAKSARKIHKVSDQYSEAKRIMDRVART